MSFPVYDIDAGECTCILGDPIAGSRRVALRKLSASGVLLDPASNLRNDQFIYASLVLEGGPSLALSGVVISTFRSGTFVRWSQEPAEAERLNRKIVEHFGKKGKRPVEAPPPPAAARAPEAAASETGRPAQAGDAPPADPEVGTSPPAGSPGRAAVAGAMDVGKEIRKRARKVRSRDLASRVETVHVIDLATIRTFIQEAVDESVTLLGHSLKEAERRRLLDEVEETFGERMEVVEAERKGLEEKTRLLQVQLEKANRLLDEERARVVSADRFTVSDTGMMELEARLSRLLDRAVLRGQAGEGLEKEMREIVARLLDDEREKIRVQAQEAQNDRIALLEKKIHRLATSLEQTEGERDRAQQRAQALEASGMIPLRNVIAAGLDGKDPNKERKMSLLKEVARFNQDLRKELASQGRLPRPRPAAPGAGGAGGAKDGGQAGKGSAVEVPDACPVAEPVKA